MATSSRHASGPHGSGAELEDLRGWRAFVHLARELKLARLARLAYPYRRRAVLSVVAMIVVTLSSLAVPYLIKVGIDSGIGEEGPHRARLGHRRLRRRLRSSTWGRATCRPT